MVDIECQICGKDVQILNKAEIEGTIIDVCDRCVQFGVKILEGKSYKPITRKIEFKELQENEFELIPNYGQMIMKYRESKGFTRDDLARKLNEKESVIRRIEEEQMIPNEQLVKDIENFLGIKLMQKYNEEILTKEQKKKLKLTVGDIVEVS